MTGRFLIGAGGHPDKWGEINRVLTAPGERGNYESIKKPDWAGGSVRSWQENLENKLQCKLDQAFRRSCAGPHRRRYCTEPGGTEAGGWHRKIWMVEQIEELGPELKTGSLSNRRALEHGEIPIVDSGSPELAVHARLSTKTPLKCPVCDGG